MAQQSHHGIVTARSGSSPKVQLTVYDPYQWSSPCCRSRDCPDSGGQVPSAPKWKMRSAARNTKKTAAELKVLFACKQMHQFLCHTVGPTPQKSQAGLLATYSLDIIEFFNFYICYPGQTGTPETWLTDGAFHPTRVK
ncbi:MAG: hypothetical protein KKA54_18175 [Proteobacteria bacterium]|nr:hypothetical protein [Pseudomonadota bacterium]MBU0968293.1 hypothetical protein [Pseudomonadota bacterium]